MTFRQAREQFERFTDLTAELDTQPHHIREAVLRLEAGEPVDHLPEPAVRVGRRIVAFLKAARDVSGVGDN